MSGTALFFGQVTLDDVLVQWQSLSATTRDGLIIFCALTLVIGSVLAWAVYIRKPKRRHHSHRHPHHSSSKRAAGATTENLNGASSESQKRRKWRRPRRDHRPRNPTLAETGGLPPPRTQESSDSQF